MLVKDKSQCQRHKSCKSLPKTCLAFWTTEVTQQHSIEAVPQGEIVRSFAPLCNLRLTRLLPQETATGCYLQFGIGAHHSSGSPVSGGSAWPRSATASVLWSTQTRTTGQARAPWNLQPLLLLSAGLSRRHSPAAQLSLPRVQLWVPVPNRCCLRPEAKVTSCHGQWYDMMHSCLPGKR